jgi:hypothetical protein
LLPSACTVFCDISTPEKRWLADRTFGNDQPDKPRTDIGHLFWS